MYASLIGTPGSDLVAPKGRPAGRRDQLVYGGSGPLVGVKNRTVSGSHRRPRVTPASDLCPAWDLF